MIFDLKSATVLIGHFSHCSVYLRHHRREEGEDLAGRLGNADHVFRAGVCSPPSCDPERGLSCGSINSNRCPEWLSRCGSHLGQHPGWQLIRYLNDTLNVWLADEGFIHIYSGVLGNYKLKRLKWNKYLSQNKVVNLVVTWLHQDIQVWALSDHQWRLWAIIMAACSSMWFCIIFYLLFAVFMLSCTQETTAFWLRTKFCTTRSPTVN